MMKMFLLSFNAFKHRSIFAVFLAIFLLFGAVKGTKAQESNGSASAFDGLENLVGIKAEQMKDYASQGKHGTFPKDKSQIFFLYNVKTGLLLNVGGYWGTHVSLQEYGMPLSVYQDKMVGFISSRILISRVLHQELRKDVRWNTSIMLLIQVCCSQQWCLCGSRYL